MSAPITRDPVLDRLHEALVASYGHRLERVVLFGSRARGDCNPDSDYDVAVFIHDPASRWDELGRLAEITSKILLETEALVSAMPFCAGAYDNPNPLMREIQRDGLEL
jgi:predicted nucleotidyltransferase